jgi:hypothetical protein
VRFTLENKGFRTGILREGERSNKHSPNPPQTRLAKEGERTGADRDQPVRFRLPLG